MGLAPSALTRFPKHLSCCEVPVPIFSQPLCESRVDSLRRLEKKRVSSSSKTPEPGTARNSRVPMTCDEGAHNG